MYWVANSCNGLLCLTDGSGDDCVVVCNPILGEFIYLPKSSNNGKNGEDFRVGVGCSPKNNQYKVIRIFTCLIRDPAMGKRLRFGDNMAEIRTLGTDSWRNVDILAFKFHFYSIPSPPCQQGEDLEVVVLGGCLCVYNCYANRPLDIWVMKDYGVCESWTKLISLDIVNDQGSTPLPSYSLCKPNSYLENGALLIFDFVLNELTYHDKLSGLRFKHLKFHGIKSGFEAIAYTPSFTSLRDIVMAGYVEVWEVTTRRRDLSSFAWKDKKGQTWLLIYSQHPVDIWAVSSALLPFFIK
ncbi:hypothetical protein TIFTF001_001727 [Ficus carica]|uniref:F-box associated beta-propeller type 1 domain-containing protein n=1 Tax=Ficus carica TaxID=3494 RepID=A0AA87Z8I8_FICCA|nr:hypothetical protein TIFTF001_001727 [Ficus carica]